MKDFLKIKCWIKLWCKKVQFMVYKQKFMSEKQNQLKSPKAQNTAIFDDEERLLRSQTQKATNQKQPYPKPLIQDISRSTNAILTESDPLQGKPKSSISNPYEMTQPKEQPQIPSKQEILELQDSIIPLSHGKRQKSLSPIKNQHSIASESHFPITGPKLNLSSMPKVQISAQPSIKSQARSTTSYLQINQQISNQPVTHFYRRQIQQKVQQSARRSHSRRTQIFSSDKKHTEKPVVSGKNSVAQQMLTQNKVQRNQPRNFYLQNDAYISKPKDEYTSKPNDAYISKPNDAYIFKGQKVENYSPVSKKQRIQSFEALSSNKSKQIQKLQEIFGSPQKASLQYWQSIYPQSKKYLASLTQVLSQEKKVLQTWQSDLQGTLRQSLFQVQQILLQKMYQICRLTVKRWVQEQIQALQDFCTEKFAYFPKLKHNIQNKQRDLQAVEKALQSFQSVYENSLERSRVYRLIEGTILSSEYTDQISQISVKVKDLISTSQQVALQFCSDKLQRSKNLVSFQYEHDKYRLDKITYDLLKALFKQQETKKKEIKKQSKKLIIPDMNIGDRIQKILQKSQNRNAETAREASFSEFSSNRLHVPMSYRKETVGGLKIRNKQKEYEQFQSEFEMRKKNFVGVASCVYEQDKRHQAMPVSHKGEENGDFETKLSSLLKKINDQKVEQKDEAVTGNPQNYNEYQQLLRRKKHANRQNFFRYIMQ